MEGTITIKKTDKAEISYGDHASWGRLPARYGIFLNDRQIGSILGERQTYMSGTSDWTIYQYEEDGNIREVKRFHAHGLHKPFSEAKDWAINFFKPSSSEKFHGSMEETKCKSLSD